MRIFALLALCATMSVACATEVGNPGPVSKPNPSVTDPAVTTTTDPAVTNTDPVYKGTLPAEIETGVFVTKLTDETVPQVTVKRYVFEDGAFGLLSFNVKDGEPAWSASDDAVDYNPATGELRAKTGANFRLYEQQK